MASVRHLNKGAKRS